MKGIITILAFLFSLFCARASHIVGGELFYDCLGSNDYEITLKLFRDCEASATSFDAPAYIFVYNNSGAIVTTLTVHPKSEDYVALPSTNPCMELPADLCIREAIYRVTINLPPISGGYDIVYQRCCRNGTIANINNPGSTGSTYVAHIPDPLLYPCNSSPRFNEYPAIAICEDIEFLIDHSATDPDGDSLVYELCSPFAGASTSAPQPTPSSPPPPPPYVPVNFLFPFSFSDPMPSVNPVSVDPQTGFLKGEPTNRAQYVIGVCVKEYRGGVHVSTHFRDFQFNVVECEPAISALIEPLVGCQQYTIDFVNRSRKADHFFWDFGVPGTDADTSNLRNPSFTYPDTGTYYITLIANPSFPCADTLVSSIFVYEAPSLSISSTQTIWRGDAVGLNVSSSMSGTFAWSPTEGLSDPSSDSPIASPQNTTTYKVVATNNYGCQDSAFVKVVVRLYCKRLVIPNAFTPNGDGHNDVFRAHSFGDDTVLDFSIFNRYGNRVFSTKDLSKGWDGKVDGKFADAGNYVYLLSAICEGEPQVLRGTVTLIP